MKPFVYVEDATRVQARLKSELLERLLELLGAVVIMLVATACVACFEMPLVVALLVGGVITGASAWAWWAALDIREHWRGIQALEDQVP
jgi:hypothetical protein